MQNPGSLARPHELLQHAREDYHPGMQVVLFDVHEYDRLAFEAANVVAGHSLRYLEPRLTAETAVLATGSPVVCSFVNDRVDAATLQTLHDGGTRLVACRSAGVNHVDLAAAGALGLTVVRVPEYSPHAVAEHAVALILALNRKLVRAALRVRDFNFSLERLTGFDMYGKTVGLFGGGRIGAVMARILAGFGCHVLVCDLRQDPTLLALGARYVSRDELLAASDIVSLHLPLTPSTHHVIDAAALAAMKPGVLLINTGRGALIDSSALVHALKSGRVGGAGLDVYEEEEGVFFEDLSDRVLQDDVLARLLTFPNVIVTSHQAFLTREALAAIAQTTLASVTAFERGEPLATRVPTPGTAASASRS